MAETGESGVDSSAVLRGVAILGGLGMVASYVLAWVVVDGLTRPRGEGQGRVQVGPDGVLAQQGFRESSGFIPGAEIALFPEIVAGMGLLVMLAAAIRWRLSTQAIVSFLGLMGAAIAVFFLTFLDGERSEIIQVGPREGPATAFEPGVGIWIVIASGLIIVAAGVGAATRERVRER